MGQRVETVCDGAVMLHAYVNMSHTIHVIKSLIELFNGHVTSLYIASKNSKGFSLFTYCVLFKFGN